MCTKSHHQTEEILKEIEKIITETIDAPDLAQHIDNVLWELAQYKMTDHNFVGHADGSDSMFFVRLIKMALLGKDAN